MTPDRALAIVFSYIAVACLGWAYGYLCGAWAERRTREGDALLSDYRGGAAYDWRVDGECAREVLR